MIHIIVRKYFDERPQPRNQERMLCCKEIASPTEGGRKIWSTERERDRGLSARLRIYRNDKMIGGCAGGARYFLALCRTSE